jgi:hypothetical protein
MCKKANKYVSPSENSNYEKLAIATNYFVPLNQIVRNAGLEEM